MGRIPGLMSFSFRQRFNYRGNQGSFWVAPGVAGDPKEVRKSFLEEAQPKHMRRVGQANGR